MCVGDGIQAKRVGHDGMQSVPCPAPDACEFAQQWGCKLFARFSVQIEGQDDELGSFIFRTTGYNSVRTLAARLEYFNAISGGNARYLPLVLRLRAKSTTLSRRTPVYYVDLLLRGGENLADAVAAAREEAKRQRELGVDVAMLEDSARKAMANGSFEESEDEGPEIVEEFYPEATTTEPIYDELPMRSPAPWGRALARNCANTESSAHLTWRACLPPWRGRDGLSCWSAQCANLADCAASAWKRHQRHASKLFAPGLSGGLCRNWHPW